MLAAQLVLVAAFAALTSSTPYTHDSQAYGQRNSHDRPDRWNHNRWNPDGYWYHGHFIRRNRFDRYGRHPQLIRRDYDTADPSAAGSNNGSSQGNDGYGNGRSNSRSSSRGRNNSRSSSRGGMLGYGNGLDFLPRPRIDFDHRRRGYPGHNRHDNGRDYPGYNRYDNGRGHRGHRDNHSHSLLDIDVRVPHTYGL